MFGIRIHKEWKNVLTIRTNSGNKGGQIFRIKDTAQGRMTEIIGEGTAAAIAWRMDRV